MRISDWSSDVCSSDLPAFVAAAEERAEHQTALERPVILRGVDDVVLLDDRAAVDPEQRAPVALSRIVERHLQVNVDPAAAREGEGPAPGAEAELAFLVVDVFVELAFAVLAPHETNAPAVLAGNLLAPRGRLAGVEDRKSTRLNSSH